ncbi:MAG: (2Fe-2S)-binding protein [Actinomycetota bacterium]
MSSGDGSILRAGFDEIAAEAPFDIGPYEVDDDFHARSIDAAVAFAPASTGFRERVDRGMDATGAPNRAVAVMVFWKSYCFVSAIRPVVSWARHRRVPDMGVTDVRIDFGEPGKGAAIAPRTARTAVLPGDPAADEPGTFAVADEDELFAFFVESYVEGHLEPAIERFVGEATIGRRGLRALATAAMTNIAARRSDGDLATRFATVDRMVADLPAPYAATSRIEEWRGREIEGWSPFPLRTACCLAYEIASHGYCVTCNLLSDEDRIELMATHDLEYRERSIPIAVASERRP